MAVTAVAVVATALKFVLMVAPKVVVKVAPKFVLMVAPKGVLRSAPKVVVKVARPRSHASRVNPESSANNAVHVVKAARVNAVSATSKARRARSVLQVKNATRQPSARKVAMKIAKHVSRVSPAKAAVTAANAVVPSGQNVVIAFRSIP